MSRIFILAATTALFSAPAYAQHVHHHHHEAGKPGWSTHVDTRTYVTEIVKADEDDEEIVDIFTHSHADASYNFGNGLSINGSVILEGDPAGHAHGGGASRSGDHFFDDHPLFIEVLTVNYDTDHYGAYLGKFTPDLGRDAHDIPGWWGMLTFEEFQIRERLGVGGYAQTHIDGLGKQRIDLSTFYADTSFLQQSAFYNRSDLNKGDGGPSNTEDFSSFSLNMSGQAGHDDITYYIGYAHQAVDQATQDDENRLVFGLTGTIDLTDHTTLRAMADVTDTTHFGGEPDHDRRYTTGGLELRHGQWTLAGTYTDIHNDAPDPVEGMNGYTMQMSGGYDITDHLGVDVGYQRQDEEGEDSDRIGLLVRYGAEF